MTWSPTKRLSRLSNHHFVLSGLKCAKKIGIPWHCHHQPKMLMDSNCLHPILSIRSVRINICKTKLHFSNDVKFWWAHLTSLFFFLNIHCSSGYLLLLPSCCSNNHSTVVSHWGHIFFSPILMFGLNTYLFWPCLHGLYALSGLLDIVHQCAGLPNNGATGWSLFFSFGHQFCFPTKLKSFKREPKLEEKTVTSEYEWLQTPKWPRGLLWCSSTDHQKWCCW